MDNIERVNSVYFELYSKEQGRNTIEEPQGWNEDFLSFEKDKESKDIRKKIELDLSFYGKGSSLLQSLYYTHGVAPTCLVLKYEKSNGSVEETWDLIYVQRLDLTTFAVDRTTGKVTLKAYEGGLSDLIKNRYDDKVDLLSEYSMDGEYIGPLKTHPFQATERRILLKSLLAGQYDRYRIGTGYWENEPDGIWSARPIPFEIVYKSDGAGDIQQPLLVQDSWNTGRARSSPADPDVDYPVEIDLPLFFEAEERKEIDIHLKGSFKIVEFEERHQAFEEEFHVRYIKSYRGEDGTQLLRDNEFITSMPIRANEGVLHSIDWKKKVVLEKGESIALVYSTLVGIDRPNIFASNGYANTWVNSDMKIVLQDVTLYPPVERRCIKPIDLFDRIVTKITGKTGLVRSNAFSPGGDFEFKVVDNGFFARGFPDKYLDENDEERAIQFNTSFKEAFEAYSGLTPMCWISQKEGSKEIVQIEPELYTLGNFIGISLDSADAIEEKSSKNDHFSKIELGHSGSLEYEEVNGLNEPNGKSTFATHLGQSTNNTYSKVSPYRFDPQGYEFTRRLYFENFPFEDTERDEDIWLHDGKLVGDLIMHRTWHDDFEAPPQGIFDPDSAWNLCHSPMNLLYRGHGHAVRRCLYHNTQRFIRFSSSNANQNLVTFVDGLRLEESGQIQIDRLQKQRIKADTVTMTVKITPQLRDQLDGVNEQGVKNVFGLVEYPDKGVNKYGRIVKLSSGENSKLELIKAGI